MLAADTASGRMRAGACSFLPARPDKNLIEGRRMTDAFIEARRVALERYLNRLAAHPAACRSEVRRPLATHRPVCPRNKAGGGGATHAAALTVNTAPVCRVCWPPVHPAHIMPWAVYLAAVCLSPAGAARVPGGRRQPAQQPSMARPQTQRAHPHTGTPAQCDLSTAPGTQPCCQGHTPHGVAGAPSDTTHTPWHLLLLLLLQATSRLLRSLVGVRQKPPTPSEAVNPAVQTRDIYRLLHENIQYYRGSFQHSPLSSEVGGQRGPERLAGDLEWPLALQHMRQQGEDRGMSRRCDPEGVVCMRALLACDCVLRCGCVYTQEVAMRDETSLVGDAATALHIALHRAEALARLAAARGMLLGETSVALAALGTFEGSYSYGDQATIQAASTAAQVRMAFTLGGDKTCGVGQTPHQPLGGATGC